MLMNAFSLVHLDLSPKTISTCQNGFNWIAARIFIFYTKNFYKTRIKNCSDLYNLRLVREVQIKNISILERLQQSAECAF